MNSPSTDSPTSSDTPSHASKSAPPETQAALVAHLVGRNRSKYARFLVAAALGSIPWVGGVVAAAVALHAEEAQGQLNELQKLWVNEHEQKIGLLGNALTSILQRVDSLGDEIRDRLESPEYLSIIRKGFRSWDQAETDEKRDFLRRLLANAGASTICSDDVVRLFIDWIDRYHELHFRVIREVYQTPRISRAQIWAGIAGDRPREDSAEADLFRLLIRDLSTGGVIRQQRITNARGQFISVKNAPRKHLSTSDTLKSAFDDTERYVLTELGTQFVHYTMNDIVPRIGT